MHALICLLHKWQSTFTYVYYKIQNIFIPALWIRVNSGSFAILECLIHLWKSKEFFLVFSRDIPGYSTPLRKVTRLGFGLSPETIIALCFMLEYHVGVFEGRLTGKNVGFCASTKRTTTHDAWMSFRKPPSWFRENIWANLYSRHPLLWKDLIQEIFRNNFSTSIHSLKEYFVLLFYYWTFN